jgi:hypothetical protein
VQQLIKIHTNPDLYLSHSTLGTQPPALISERFGAGYVTQVSGIQVQAFRGRSVMVASVECSM